MATDVYPGILISGHSITHLRHTDWSNVLWSTKLYYKSFSAHINCNMCKQPYNICCKLIYSTSVCFTYPCISFPSRLLQECIYSSWCLIYWNIKLFQYKFLLKRLRPLCCLDSLWGMNINFNDFTLNLYRSITWTYRSVTDSCFHQTTNRDDITVDT
jgi:hypothetical protein